MVLQVFIAMAVFLGDGLYNFAKIAIVSMLAIRNDVRRKPKQQCEGTELSCPSAADAAADPKVPQDPGQQPPQCRAGPAGQLQQPPAHAAGAQHEEPASPNCEAALLKKLRDQMFLHEAVPW